MASNPPSGASRLPEIRSFFSFSVNRVMLLVRGIVFWKEKGGSLSGHGCFSLGEKGRLQLETNPIDQPDSEFPKSVYDEKGRPGTQILTLRDSC